MLRRRSLPPTAALDTESGASALLIAIAMLTMLGFAAIAIDVGAAFNERRQNQTASDVAVMGASVDFSGGTAAMRDTALALVRMNLTDIYADSEWASIWAACQDPERASLNAAGFAFLAIGSPAAWAPGVPTGTPLDCLSWDPRGYLRVKVPDQLVETTVGRVLGIDALKTSADSIVEFQSRQVGGGILPFALVGGQGAGSHVCLRSNAPGQIEPPCGNETYDEGNFGGIDVPIFRYYFTGACYEANKNTMRAINTAEGVDHILKPYTDSASALAGTFAGAVIDTCANLNGALVPDTVETFTGLASGLVEGLATGGNPLPASLEPRLQKTDNARSVFGYPLDNTPLWDFFLDDGDLAYDESAGALATLDYGVNAPASCEPPLLTVWQELEACLVDYASGSWDVQIVDQAIEANPRFSYVPEYWELDLPDGASEPRHIRRFRAVYLQGTWWFRNAQDPMSVFHPGEPGTFSGAGNWTIRQLSAFVIPDFALPPGLRGDPPPFGGLDPLEPVLYQ